jgi:hypothetical protein
VPQSWLVGAQIGRLDAAQRRPGRRARCLDMECLGTRRPHQRRAPGVFDHARHFFVRSCTG